ncbi:hypothetical protein LQZ21_07775 [Treponema sp. TIM-1]|uniref:hypothetical protein n=1 Tax=Treponema sp. TIM-1 TaxID=2898417 RepID=UPI00397EB2AA
MLKKSLIFGSAVLFLAALITLTGCPTSVDDDSSSGLQYAHRIYGSAVSPYQAQEAIDRAVAAREPIVLEDGLTIVGPGHLNFKNAQVRIDGLVRFPNGTVSVVDADVAWGETGSFILINGEYIHRPGQNTKPVNVEALVEYAESLETIMPTAIKAAVKRFKLGSKQNHDYSTNPNGVDARINAEKLVRLFVLDELVIDSSATNPGPGIPAKDNLILTALGTVDVIGTPPDSVIVGGGPITLGTCSTLTTSKGGVVVPVPAGTAPNPTLIPNINVAAEKNFIIDQETAGALTIAGKLTGAGTLEVLGAVGDIIIRGGDGSIKFSGTADPDVIDIASTGTVTFDSPPTVGGSALSLSGAVSTIAGDVVFNRSVSTSAVLQLFGNVTLEHEVVLTLASDENPLFLGAGKIISVRFTPRGGDPIVAPILTAGPDTVELIRFNNSGSSVTLTAPGNPTNANGIPAAKRLTLAGDDLRITDGILQVAPEAALAISGVTLRTNTDGPTQFGYLAVADGGSLISPSTTTGTINIGHTTITGTSTLKASGGTITLGNNKIAGSVLGATLSTTAGVPTFGLATADILSLEQANLNLATNGIISIVAGSRVILTERGKITLNNGEGGVETTRSKIGDNITLSGGFVGLTSPTATTTQNVWSVAHRDVSAADVSIVAGAAVTLSKSGTTFNN